MTSANTKEPWACSDTGIPGGGTGIAANSRSHEPWQRPQQVACPTGVLDQSVENHPTSQQLSNSSSQGFGSESHRFDNGSGCGSLEDSSLWQEPDSRWPPTHASWPDTSDTRLSFSLDWFQSHSVASNSSGQQSPMQSLTSLPPLSSDDISDLNSIFPFPLDLYSFPSETDLDVNESPHLHPASSSKPHNCHECGKSFQYPKDLMRHQITHSVEPQVFYCPVDGCYSQKKGFRRLDHFKRHIVTIHQYSEAMVKEQIDRYKPGPKLPCSCNQCCKQFSSRHALGKHASETGHASFYCSEEGCGKTYSRFDVFLRHQHTHRLDVPRFPCSYCPRYSGANGFKRKDHLTQHLRNCHPVEVDERKDSNTRICPHDDCMELFQKSSDYIMHMRKVHKESEFPCTERNCDRTGPKGYFRMRDLQKHKLKQHGIPIE